MPNDIVIRNKPTKLVIFALAGLAMSFASIAMAVVLYRRGQFDSFGFFIGCVGALFFGLGFCLIVARLVANEPGLVISGEGLLVPTLAPQTIPWAGLRGLRLATYKSQRLIELDIDPDVERELSLTRMVRWTRVANRNLGFAGLCISTGLLDQPPEQVAELIIQNVEAHRGANRRSEQ